MIILTPEEGNIRVPEVCIQCVVIRRLIERRDYHSATGPRVETHTAHHSIDTNHPDFNSSPNLAQN